MLKYKCDECDRVFDLSADDDTGYGHDCEALPNQTKGEADTPDIRGELSYYGLTEDDVVRLVGDVVVDKKAYLAICEQYNDGHPFIAIQQRVLGELVMKNGIEKFLSIRSMLLSSHPLFPNKGEAYAEAK